MSTVNKTGKQDRIRNQEASKRLAWLRTERFVTEGFHPASTYIPLAEARAVAAANLRLIAAQRPQPSVRS